MTFKSKNLNFSVNRKEPHEFSLKTEQELLKHLPAQFFKKLIISKGCKIFELCRLLDFMLSASEH